jgi:hypothetical protein
MDSTNLRFTAPYYNVGILLGRGHPVSATLDRQTDLADPLWLARTSSVLKLLTIRPEPRILPSSMHRLLVALLATFLSVIRSRRDLVIENLALRQQLATLAGRQHPDIRPADRAFWILVRRSWSGWAASLAAEGAPARKDGVLASYRPKHDAGPLRRAV